MNHQMALKCSINEVGPDSSPERRRRGGPMVGGWPRADRCPGEPRGVSGGRVRGEGGESRRGRFGTGTEGTRRRTVAGGVSVRRNPLRGIGFGADARTARSSVGIFFVVLRGRRLQRGERGLLTTIHPLLSAKNGKSPFSPCVAPNPMTRIEFSCTEPPCASVRHPGGASRQRPSEAASAGPQSSQSIECPM